MLRRDSRMSGLGERAWKLPLTRKVSRRAKGIFKFTLEEKEGFLNAK